MPTTSATRTQDPITMPTTTPILSPKGIKVQYGYFRIKRVQLHIFDVDSLTLKITPIEYASSISYCQC